MSCKILTNNFPAFTVDNKELIFVKEFRYLGTVITDCLGDDRSLTAALLQTGLASSSTVLHSASDSPAT